MAGSRFSQGARSLSIQFPRRSFWISGPQRRKRYEHDVCLTGNRELMNAIDMNGTSTPGPRQNSSHFSLGSALLECMAGKLGAPECWTNERPFGHTGHGDLRALTRWENEGGKTLSLPLP
jgi:hypothetical protein